MQRSRLIGGLVGLNLALLFCLVGYAVAPRTAVAQDTSLAGNYMMVTGEVQEGFEALYMIDMKSRTLHAFVYDRTGRQLVYLDRASLERDFRNNKD